MVRVPVRDKNGRHRRPSDCAQAHRDRGSLLHGAGGRLPGGERARVDAFQQDAAPYPLVGNGIRPLYVGGRILAPSCPTADLARSGGTGGQWHRGARRRISTEIQDVVRARGARFSAGVSTLLYDGYAIGIRLASLIENMPNHHTR